MTATHLLIHRYVPGTGPQEGTAEHEAEMRQWAALDARLRDEGVIVGAYALQNRGSLVQAHATSEWQSDGEIVFAVHAINAESEGVADEIARSMPTAEYGTVEVRPLMDAS